MTVLECDSLSANKDDIALGFDARWCVRCREVERKSMIGDNDGLPLCLSRGDKHHIGAACRREIDGETSAVRQRERTGSTAG